MGSSCSSRPIWLGVRLRLRLRLRLRRRLRLRLRLRLRPRLRVSSCSSRPTSPHARPARRSSYLVRA